jgi:hypothetical protein
VGHDRQQLDVREAEVADVGRQLVGELEIRQRAVVLERVAPPRAEVHLVDRHRPGQRRAAGTLGEVGRVVPLVRRLVDDRRRLRRLLGLEGERVGLHEQLAGLGADLELVARPGGDGGDEELPDAGGAERPHRVQPAVPEVEVPDDAHRPRGRRPDRERGPPDAVDLAHVGAHLRPQLLVAPLAEEVLVEVRQRRREAVRVGRREGVAVREVDLELVVQRQLDPLQLALEHPAGVDAPQLDARRLHDHRLRARVQRAHDDAAADRMRAEQRMRVVMVARDEPVDLRHGVTSTSSRRAMPATGMATQSGRLLSS